MVLLHLTFLDAQDVQDSGARCVERCLSRIQRRGSMADEHYEGCKRCKSRILLAKGQHADNDITYGIAKVGLAVASRILTHGPSIVIVSFYDSVARTACRDLKRSLMIVDDFSSRRLSDCCSVLGGNHQWSVQC